MLFKNHHGESESLVPCLDEVITQGKITSVLYSDPFLKAGFMSRLMKETKAHVLYLDLDLLCSGYVASGTITLNENSTLYQPTEDTIDGILTEVLVKASASQVLIIVDSINGLFNLLNSKKQPGKVVSSIVMLLASMIRQTNSCLVIASMARYKKEEGWVLSPTGKRLVETEKSKKILLEYGKEGITVNAWNKPGKIFLPANSMPL